MTIKEQLALRLAVIQLRVTLKMLDGIEAKVAELSVGHAASSREVIHHAVCASITGFAQADLRKVVDALELDFPGVRR